MKKINKEKLIDKEKINKFKDELQKKHKEGTIKNTFLKKIAKIMFDKKEEEK